MYHVSAQGVDERMINVHYYYYYQSLVAKEEVRVHGTNNSSFHNGKVISFKKQW